MAVITDSNLRHVRKTVTFDGGANNGNLGDDVPVFTLTGRVLVDMATAYVTVNLACASAAGTQIFIRDFWDFKTTVVTTGAPQWWDYFNGGFNANAQTANFSWFNPLAVDRDVVLTVQDAGGGADVTAGTIIVDIWYLPITDDGALAGDDIDTGYIPVNVAQISGDATAADRLESLMDGIVAGIVGTGSTTTSIANCTGFTEATNDHFNGRLITFLTGNLAGQQTQITDYVGSTQTFTCAALTEAPANTDTFVIS